VLGVTAGSAFRHGEAIQPRHLDRLALLAAGGELPFAPDDAASLPGDEAGWALQHPDDWIDAASDALVELSTATDGFAGTRVVGLATTFTSCTVLPVVRRGGDGLVPLCFAEPDLSLRPHAWAKLWKHHSRGAAAAADTLTAVLRAGGGGAGGALAYRDDPHHWLRRYGGVVGLEWLFPKLLEIYREDKEVYARADTFIEAGDWVTSRLTARGVEGLDTEEAQRLDVVEAQRLYRSTCQAGFKGLWCQDTRQYLPTRSMLDRAEPGFAGALDKLAYGASGAAGEAGGWGGEGTDPHRHRHVAPGSAVGFFLAGPGAGAATAEHGGGSDDDLSTRTGRSAALEPLLPCIAQAASLGPGFVALAEAARRENQPIAVSASSIDAHAGTVGVGAEPGTMVLVLGTSACYMMSAEQRSEGSGGGGGGGGGRPCHTCFRTAYVAPWLEVYSRAAAVAAATTTFLNRHRRTRLNRVRRGRPN
jgi:hypothetical protein